MIRIDGSIEVAGKGKYGVSDAGQLTAKKLSSDGGAIASDGAGNLSAASLIPANGISATIVTAQLTAVTGTQGSMTFVNGILTAQTPAT